MAEQRQHIPADLDDVLYEQIYDRFVIENYYGGDSEPVTPEFFKECWGEMSWVEKLILIERSTKKGN